FISEGNSLIVNCQLSIVNSGHQPDKNHLMCRLEGEHLVEEVIRRPVVMIAGLKPEFMPSTCQ
ncbi:MAG: hypothetical protein IKU14_09895, partial [Rhodocyclaceae bacterium]|nr:hypothetical protein [Rhodocyclaceae bacterium]